jgi:hypothetical protein
VFISKESPTNIAEKCINFVWQKAATSETEKYVLWHILPTQNTTRRSVLLTGCVIKGKGHCVYMDGWFSSPKNFDHLWGCKTKVAGTVMSNKKEVPKQTFFWRNEKRQKISRQRDHLLAVQWKD